MRRPAPKTAALMLVVLVASLAACGPKPDDAQAPVPSSGSAAPATASALLAVDPAGVADCQPVVATVRWDVRKTHPQITTVQVFAGNDASSTLFAEGGPQGSAETGQWTGSGSRFILRDKADGKDLANVRVTGPACG